MGLQFNASQDTLAYIGKQTLTLEAERARAQGLAQCNQALTDEVQRLKAELEKLAPAEAGTD